MLNKIKLIGSFLPSLSSNTREEREKKGLKIYFSIRVTNPSNVITSLRCVARQIEIVERIEKELQKGDIIEVSGYLRNEKANEQLNKKRDFSDQIQPKEQSRQILTIVTEFKKLNISFEEIDKKSSNQIQLIGKIITDFEEREEPGSLGYRIQFKISVPREKNDYSPLYFCRVQEEKLIDEFKKQLKRGDIILLEGFLQSQTKKKKKIENGQVKEEFYSISAIICRGFTFLSDDSANVFSSLRNFTRVFFENVKEYKFEPRKENLDEIEE